MAEESSEPKADRITKDTAIAFRRLIRENRLPNKVITAASAYMDDISALAS